MNESRVWEQLCRRLKKSDDGAFEQIFRLIRDDLLQYVRSIVRDGTTAHDLVQDVFVSLWDLRESLDPARPLRAYVFRMGRNRAYRHLRDKRLHVRKQVEMEHGVDRVRPTTPDGDVDAATLTNRLGLWIEQLPDRQREALVLTRFHGLSHREVASIMGISPRTVNNHIARALGAIRRRLIAYDTLVEDNEPKQETRRDARARECSE